MIKYLQGLLRPLTATEIMMRELNCAEIDRLHAQTALDFAKSVVDYNTARIKRLESCIRSQA